MKAAYQNTESAPVNALHNRIRTLRLHQQRTLKDVAERCGFTVSLLSKIESGKTMPPVATLTKIASALGVTVGDLLSGKHDEVTAFSPASSQTEATLTRTDKGYGFHLLAAERAKKFMQPFIFVAERGKIAPKPLAHRGEEYLFILEGSMRFQVGSTHYTLGPGDSLYFSSEQEHDFEPLTPSVRYLAVFCESSPSAAPAPAIPAAKRVKKLTTRNLHT